MWGRSRDRRSPRPRARATATSTSGNGSKNYPHPSPLPQGAREQARREIHPSPHPPTAMGGGASTEDHVKRAFLLLTVLVAACGPTARSTDSSAPGQPATSAQSNRTLNIVMRVEPPDILAGAVDRSAIHKPLFTATLGGWDRFDEPYPVLAQAVPQLNTETWRVFPDGHMETVYKLRPGLTWHDGHPLTADDFAFTRPAELYVVESGIE